MCSLLKGDELRRLEAGVTKRITVDAPDDGAAMMAAIPEILNRAQGSRTWAVGEITLTDQDGGVVGVIVGISVG